MGTNCRVDRLCKGCIITLADRALKVDLRILDMTGYDVILGMNWLTVYKALLDYHRRRIIFVCQMDLRFALLEGNVLVFLFHSPIRAISTC